MRTFLVLISLFCVGTLQGDRFIVWPTSQIVPLDSTGTVTFHCVVIGNFINTDVRWFIDGLFHETAAIEARGIDADTEEDPVAGTLNSTLTIPPTTVNNMTNITCSIFLVDDSSEVSLLIQGILAPPSNLAIGHVNDYNQRLTWTPPFTLDITDVDPDITYSVCCNVTNCTSTTNIYYAFPTLCDPAEFTVNAVNPVGESEPRSIVFNPIYTQRPTTINMIKEEVSFRNSTQPVVVFLFQIDGNCTGLYEAKFNGNYTGMVTFEPTIPTVNANGTMNLTYHTRLQPNDVYCGNITQQNSSDMIQETNFTTFDVQSSNSLEGRGGRISIICIFAEGSQARGCFVIISRLGTEPSVVKNSEASREQGIGNATASFTGLPAGIYSIAILDIEEDGSIESRESLYEEVVIIDGPVMTSAASPTPTTRVAATATPSPSDAVDVPDENNTDSSSLIIGVAVCIIIVIVLAVLTTVVLVIMGRQKRGRKRIDLGAVSDGAVSDEDTIRYTEDHSRRLVSDCSAVAAQHSTNMSEDGHEPRQRQRRNVDEEGYGSCSEASDSDITENPVLNVILGESGPPPQRTPPPPYSEVQPMPQQGSHYATIAPLPSGSQTNPTIGDGVQYAEVKGSQNPQGLVYAHLGARPSDAPPIPPSQGEKSQYSQILPHTTQPQEEASPLPPSYETATQVADQPPTLDTLTELLQSVTSKWYQLGLYLGVSDDLLDEIYTNMTTEHDCMVEMLDWRLQQVKPLTWREVAEALHQLGERQLAETVAETHDTGILSASSLRNVTPTREETEDNKSSILDPGLQPAPFQPDSGLVVASIPPPHISSETASLQAKQGEQAGPSSSEIPPTLPPRRIAADPDAPPLPPRQESFV